MSSNNLSAPERTAEGAPLVARVLMSAILLDRPLPNSFPNPGGLIPKISL